MTGFKVNRFVDLSERESNHLICSICLNIFRNAIRSDCEHTFCRQCIEDWIKTNKKDCPECRKAFIKRKRNSKTSSDDNTLIVIDFVFRTNLLINNMINDLRIKCDNERKGCQQVIQLGLLSSHLKKCEHRLCKTCGFTVGTNGDHISGQCIELLKSDRNDWKNKFQEVNEKELKLNEELNQLKEEYLKLRRNCKQLERLPPIPETTSSLYDSIPDLSLEPTQLFLGTYQTQFERLSTKSNGIYLSQVSAERGPKKYNIEISFVGIKEMFNCLDKKNIIIELIFDASLQMKANIFGTDSPNAYKFDLNSYGLSLNLKSINLIPLLDTKHWYIIIVLKDKIDVYVSHLISRLKDIPELKVAEISPKVANIFIERAQK